MEFPSQEACSDDDLLSSAISERQAVVLPRAFVGIADGPYDIARQLLTLPDHLKTDCFSVHFIKVVLTIAAQQTLAVVQFSN